MHSYAQGHIFFLYFFFFFGSFTKTIIVTCKQQYYIYQAYMYISISSNTLIQISGLIQRWGGGGLWLSYPSWSLQFYFFLTNKKIRPNPLTVLLLLNTPTYIRSANGYDISYQGSDSLKVFLNTYIKLNKESLIVPFNQL